VIGVETDILFPLHQQKEIADALTGNGIKTEFTKLASIMGHDAFLVDYDHFTPIIEAYFKQICADDELA
jgi:homoserine acetyltransferase